MESTELSCRTALARDCTPAHTIPGTFVPRPRQLCLLLMFLLAVFAPAARAQLTIDQTTEAGLKPYGAFDHDDFDSVSLSTGTLDLHIPLISYPQRGGKLSLNFFLTFQGGGYSFSNPPQGGCPRQPGVCNWGTVDSGPGIGIVSNLQLSANVSGVLPPYDGPYAVIETPEGSQHEVGATANGWRTIDATGYLCVSNCATIIDRSGIRYQYSAPNGSLQRVEDPNGNYISTTLGTNGVVTGYVDTMGRNVPAFSTSFTGPGNTSLCTGSLPTTAAYAWTLPSYQGGSFIFTVCYANDYFGDSYCIQRLPNPPQCSITWQHNSVIQSIVLPDGTFWRFYYNSGNPNTQTPATGTLSRIDLPTGGSLSYSWAGHYHCQDPSAPNTTLFYTYAVTGRSLIPNVGPAIGTAYGFADVPWNTSTYTTTSKDSLQNLTNHTFSIMGVCQFYETQTVYQNSSGATLKTVTTDYHADGDPMFIVNPKQGTNSNVVPIRVTTLWPNGQTSKVETDYDSGV